MGRETTKITQTTIGRALRMMQSQDADDMEIADTLVPGLLIRIRKRSAVWALRCRVAGIQHYKTIGPLILLPEPDMVRAAAEQAKALLRAGEDPASLFAALALAPTLADAEALAEHRKGKVWVWEDARKKFLAACLEHNRPDTVRTYRSALSLVDLASLSGKMITRIEPDDIRRIRESIRARGKIAQSKLTMRSLKAMFSWVAEQPDGGLKINPAKDVATSVKDRPAMLVDAIAAAEAFNEADDEREFSVQELQLLDAELANAMPPAARLALQLALKTVQRRLTVASALKASFRPHAIYGMVWWVHPGVLKIGRTRHGQVRRHPHIIPLPQGAQDIVRTALALTRPDNPFLFPQLRLRRKGDPGTAHMSERLLNEVLTTLQEPGRPLHASQQFNTHTFRAWFKTHMGKLKFDKSHAKLILDHAEGRSHDTTDEHYDLEQSLPAKLAILSAWDNLIAGEALNGSAPISIADRAGAHQPDNDGIH